MIKILTQNGIENTNLDGARDGYFNSGGKDGISSGILNNGTLTAQGNVLTLDTCEMRIKGHRIVIDEPITKTISGFPTVDTNYQFIAKITYNDGSVTFDTEVRPTTNLIQDDILNGNGTYEVVIGEFIHKTDGTIANLVQIMRVIFGGSGGVGAKGTGYGAEIFNGYEDNAANIASGEFSHAEGVGTKASGNYSHSEGDATQAIGAWSHAQGRGTKASGNYSHAQGYLTTASGDYSHAEGNQTTASGNGSHAEGDSTLASGNYSHSEGDSTLASGESQHAQGKYNVEDTENKYAHIVGNGESDTARSNAHTLDWSGNAWYAGKVSGGTEDHPAPVVNANDYVTKKYFDDYKAADGKDGTTFTPSVSEDGIISWTNDGGKGNPAPVNIKGPKGDSGVASGTVNSNEPGNSDTNGYTQKAVNGIVQNPNLLINPDFAINQRGQESYTGAGYGVDRWTVDAGATLTPQNDGIKLIGGCRQFYEYPNKLWGKTVTLSFKTASGITSKSGTLPDVAPSANITLVSTNTDDSGVSAVVRYVSNRIAVVISATTETIIYWVKLEIGSVATAFSHPSIAEELIKCQRYYQIRSNSYTIETNAIDRPIPMRVNGTIGTTTINNVEYNYCDAEI